MHNLNLIFRQAAVDFLSWNKYADKSFVFCDQTLIDKCRSGEQVRQSLLTSYSVLPMHVHNLIAVRS